MFGYRVVYSDFDPKTPKNALTADNLAQYAIESVAKCVKAGLPFMNGVRYLLDSSIAPAFTQLPEI